MTPTASNETDADEVDVINLLLVEEEERRYLVDEVLSDILETIAAARIHVGILVEMVSAPEAREKLDQVESCMSAAGTGLHALEFDLSPRVIEEGSLPDLASRLLARLQAEAGVRCYLKHNLRGPIPLQVRTAAFRSMQGALRNALTQEASEVHVEIRYARGLVTVSILHDGVDEGSSLKGAVQRLVVEGLRVRARALGGHCAVETTSDGDIQLILTLPVTNGWDDSRRGPGLDAATGA